MARSDASSAGHEYDDDSRMSVWWWATGEGQRRKQTKRDREGEINGRELSPWTMPLFFFVFCLATTNVSQFSFRIYRTAFFVLKHRLENCTKAWQATTWKQTITTKRKEKHGNHRDDNDKHGRIAVTLRCTKTTTTTTATTT